MGTRIVYGSLVAALTVVLGQWAFNSHAGEGVRPIPDESPRAHSTDTRAFMQAKLSASQRVLEGLLNQDFEGIEAAAKILRELAESTPAAEEGTLESRVYDHFRTEFVRLAAHLGDAARAGNLDATAYVHENLTSTCIACHQHLRDAEGASSDRVTSPTDSQPQPARR